jgi:translation initiation factor IF-2
MAGRVRIFELAKELGLSSKELIGLFERLGLEAKNQLSVVEGPIADLVRGVLLGGKSNASRLPSAIQAFAGTALLEHSAPTVHMPSIVDISEAPVSPVSEEDDAADAAPPQIQSEKPVSADDDTASPRPQASESVRMSAPAQIEGEPIPTLRPVANTPRRPPAPKPPVQSVIKHSAPAQPPAQPVIPRPQNASAEGAQPSASPPPRRKPEGGAPRLPHPPARPMPPRPPRPGDIEAHHGPIPQLRPVPTGQSSIRQPQPQPQAQPQAPLSGAAASATPGPPHGFPGRPGVAPRPGQPGVPGQGYQPPQQGGGGRLMRPQGPPPRRGNGPFTPRPFTPAGNGPFRPNNNAPRQMQPGTSITQSGPTPSSGGSRGPQPRTRDHDGASKKDREQELLLEKERRRKHRGSLDAAPAKLPAVLETIEIPDVLTVQELATSMIVPAADVIKELIKMGTMATINQNIPADTARNVAKKFGFNAVIKEAGEEVVVEQEEDRPELMTIRPPVVTVLGHVDHGKTSLLDRIRRSNVAGGEAGGITQRIGAYTVEHGDRKITFIDTPGHEAFTAMRARGAKVTDVAILVVAADDGVMPQTIEAISHAQAAGVPIVVALNKMDKEGAQVDRIKTQLSQYNLQPVDWGGKTEMVPVSAKTGMGIDELLETVLLEADIRELKANKNRRAQGVVIESALDKGRGAVATLLVQNGTLRVGDIVVVGGAFGKVRALMDDKGKQVKKAGPSMPVEIMGLSDVPSAGDKLMVVSDERVAREAAAKRSSRRQDIRIAASSGPRVSLETFMQMPADGGQKALNLVLKADGQGAVEALRARVESLSTTEVNIRVIYAGVGGITPNDVNLAAASNAVLIGFNIRPDETVKRLAQTELVDLRFYQVIYEVENDLKKAMIGMLAPKFREIVLGRAEVREVFKVSKIGAIAGCYVQSGKLSRKAKVRVLRDSAVVFDGELESLRRFKDDVKEVAENFECGVQVARYQDLKTGDVVEAYASELVAPEPLLF